VEVISGDVVNGLYWGVSWFGIRRSRQDMNKLEIEQFVFREVMTRVTQGKSFQEATVEVCIEVYNRAIDDALKLKEDMYPHDGSYSAVDVDKLEQLKIRYLSSSTSQDQDSI
jgi:hypothetical protein